MKRLFLLVCIFVGLTANAYAEPYFGLGVQAFFLDDSNISDGYDTGEITFDTGFGLSGIIGNSYDQGRFELEVSYRQADMDTVTLDGYGSASVLDGQGSALSLLGNWYLDLKMDRNIAPYFGVGAGVSRVEAELYDESDDVVFAYQIGAGIGFNFDDFTTDIGYRYFATSDPNFDGIVAEFSSHNIFLGFRFR